ncbi:metal ABC transporter substrate-binding protein [Enterococcus ureilyticus]|uniref:Metal ABC transporter substrate-binding protein n=1 Tax=Enterococcus ureilyticus TaxID=1131292 RepID=A0A1E5HAL2_9ENTE|nr:MetQ/NlpA family ABC transporter substrate-binding protein [Enterococcus ureilyticus]MBM7688861.1 D-methionine transport system substrate-binding protein [Enterococcus ureilyticus]MBO0445380.1 metal ABC transporter substrate-binding protein [Enterococcus ureilyticus]OEG21991.1 metal ABC transporter substrate-binding protein [Enterococcus ureilyticus]
MKKKLVGVLLIITGIIGITACGNNDQGVSEKKESKVIRVGTSPGPYSELFLEAVKPILEKEGYQIEQTEFTELIQADVALTEGAIDLNVDQHTAYLNNFNENKAAHLVGITSIPTVPAGLFPGRKTNLEEVKEQDKIGIPDDASNTARAFNLLEKAGWIKLKEGVDPVKATKEDIESNPKNLELIQMSSAQIPRSLADLDYAVIPGSIVYSAKLEPNDSLLSEDVLKEYELVATVDEKNSESAWAKDVVKAYHSDTFKNYLKEHNQGNYWFIPKEL